MASTSKYDLFLSFRGEDTRHSFTDHLYDALRKAGITTFRDDNDIREGQELKSEIERAIQESRASIIVFSKHYADSSWCLDELCLILEQNNKCSNHFVLALFYKVDPSDVRNQRGSFSIEAKDGANEGSKWTQDNVNRWKAALREVANLKGMLVHGYETIFIPNIVNKVHCELGLKLYSTPTGLIGVDTRAADINSWLISKQQDHPVLAICGMGGSGKTTLAKHIYFSNKQNFDNSSLIEDIENQPEGLFGVQKKLLRDVSGNNNMMISNVYEGALQLEKVIQMNRVLIVVDDVVDKDQVSTLFGTQALHTQSRIIITTRHLNIDKWFESISCGCRVHEIELLNDHESLGLLSSHAFGSQIPMEGFEELAIQLAKYCGGNPLALKVLGSSLPVSAQDHQDHKMRNNMIKIWRSRVNSMNSLHGDLESKIQDVLKRSYESLPLESHKELFLHIACFFVGEDAHTLEEILEDGWQAKYGIMTLVNRCLLTIPTNSGKLAMHQLLQDMGRQKVRNESKDPAKRSRVWRDKESYSLLRKGDGSDTLEGLALNMGITQAEAAKQGMTFEAIKTSALVKMKSLKYLKFSYVALSGSYENFPELIWLIWYRCQLKTIPPGLMSSSLVAIHMKHAEWETFDPPTDLHSLKILDLVGSYKLVKICNLHRLPKLERLVLGKCMSLIHVCNSIGKLENLSFLNLQGCAKFWMASSNQQTLFPLPQSLSHLDIENNPFEKLPSHINLTMVQELYLRCCTNLKSLQHLPVTLEELNVDWCSALENIKFESARFTLRVFNYEGCFNLSEIQGLFKLVSVAELDEADLGRHMKWAQMYDNHKVDLVGDMITKGRRWKIQMLYEYGIRSIYLQGIKDQSLTTHEYTSSSEFLSFHVPSHTSKRMIQGLNVTFLYRSSGEHKDMLPPFIKISNKTKGVTLVYSPVVYCKPRVDNDVVWLSYWPIGNMLDVANEVHVNIFVDNRVMIARGCGASLVYVEDGELVKQENCEREDMIGGDLSEFKVTEGGYYLCRYNFFDSTIPDWLFGHNIQIRDSRRWRTPSESIPALYHLENTFRNVNRNKIYADLGVSFSSESETDGLKKALANVAGVESYCIHKENGRIRVFGRFDPQAVATCVREFEMIVQVLAFGHIMG